jgi:hypothetical protein
LDNPVQQKNNSLQLTIENIKDGPDSIEKGAYRYFPKSPRGGLLWVEVTAANTGAVPIEFDFQRVRLIAEEYVAGPLSVVSSNIFAKESSFFRIKPQDYVTRWLVYVYPKGKYPYRVVYDNFVNGRVTDTIKIDLANIGE